jgi:hypothetical protein
VALHLRLVGRQAVVLVLAAVAYLGHATAYAQCEGDCNRNRVVSVDELVTGVNITLGSVPSNVCKSFDRTEDGKVTVDELATAVNRALEGCVPVLDVWQPTTVPFDPECKSGCQDELIGTKLAHGFDEAHLQWNPAVDDAVAQWGDCLASMLRCFREQHDVRACAAEGDCPTQCKALFTERAPAGADDRALLRVLDGVYVNDDAPCRPPPRVEP